MGNFNSRKFKGGAYAVVLSLLVVVIIIAINLLASAFFPQKDLTSLGTYSLADETKAYLKTLSSDVTMYYIVENGEESVLFTNLAKMFAKESEHLTLEYRDPVQYPQFVYRYNNMGEIRNNSIILVNNADPDRYCYIDYEDMCIYATDTSSFEIQRTLYGYDAEQEIVKGLIGITGEDFKKVYFTTGHGEEKTVLTNEGKLTETLSSLLELNQFQVDYLDLTNKSGVPDDCDLLVIAGPEKDLSSQDREKIQSWLNEGADLMVFLCLDYSGTGFPELTTLLDYYGMTLEEGMVNEGDSAHTMSENSSYVLTTYDGSNVLWGLGCGVSIRDNLRDTLQVSSLAYTTQDAYLRTDFSELTKQEGDKTGSFSLLTVAKEEYLGEVSNVYVFNTFLFLSDSCMDEARPLGNRALLLSVLSEISGAEQEISIPVKRNAEEALVMTNREKTSLAVISIGVVPGLLLLAGVVAVVKRRK